MPTCFVSMQFGLKTMPDGRVLDYNFLYREIIRPALEEIGFECHRLDDLMTDGSIWHKTMFAAVISSDVMIADITSGNANVFYELGIRHALRRGRTILISAGGSQAANISLLPVVFYQSDETGRISGIEEFRSQLQSIIRQTRSDTASDSPIFEFFPDLEVTLPPEMEKKTRKRGPRLTKGQRAFVQSVLESPSQAKGDLERSEAEFRGAPEADPTAFMDLLKRYRDLSEWDRVVALADDAPSEIRQSPEVRNMLVLALNRRNGSGDQERAISLMEQQIAETGGDSESFGILGRIYKDRYDQAREREDSEEATKNLDKAIETYRVGFDKNPKDYYPGINVVNLLVQRGDEAARTELETLVPRVRSAVQEKLEGDRINFWDLATDLQLAAVARDWPRAQQRASAMMAQSPAEWMIETTLRDINAVGKTFLDEADQSQLKTIISILQIPTSTTYSGGVS
ncbi:MAG TPA: TRAFs-binding domain-containing protein [Pyrinomonadaceae bacterium]|nr:TRAFs-binding domain-containing protein [Pyrinomonadaceae bacterium]